MDIEEKTFAYIPDIKIYPMETEGMRTGFFMPTLNTTVINLIAGNHVAKKLSEVWPQRELPRIMDATMFVTGLAESYHSYLCLSNLRGIMTRIEIDVNDLLYKALEYSDKDSLQWVKNLIIHGEIYTSRISRVWKCLHEIYSHLSVKYWLLEYMKRPPRLSKEKYRQESEFLLNIAESFIQATLKELKELFPSSDVEELYEGSKWMLEELGLRGYRLMVLLASDIDLAGKIPLQMLYNIPPRWDVNNRFKLILDTLKEMLACKTIRIKKGNFFSIFGEVLKGLIDGECFVDSSEMAALREKQKFLYQHEELKNPDNEMLSRPWKQYFLKTKTNGTPYFMVPMPLSSLELTINESNSIELLYSEDLTVPQKKIWIGHLNAMLLRYRLLIDDVDCPWDASLHPHCNSRTCNSCSINKIVKKFRKISTPFSSIEIDSRLKEIIRTDTELKSLEQLVR